MTSLAHAIILELFMFSDWSLDRKSHEDFKRLARFFPFSTQISICQRINY